MKIDLGLLFITLTMIIVFVNWVEQLVKAEGKIPSLANLAQPNSVLADAEPSFFTKNNLIITLGILSGFALGIKFTALFLILGIFSGIWYVHSGKIGLITVFLLSFSILLIGRVDDMSGARAYHLSANILQWGLFFGGIVLMGMLFIGKRQELMKSIRVSVLFGSLLFIGFAHWPVKNAIESDQLTIRTLLFGKPNGPVGVNPRSIKKNWELLKGE